jgi:para-nitrobenzyl esterase
MIRVAEGLVEGVEDGTGVRSFKGIPFAAAPVGDLRWRAPEPARSWAGVLKADSFGPACFQDAGFALMMGIPQPFSEDCLYLNVWTAAVETGEKRAVMVWIHGGAFICGGTSAPIYDGTKLARMGVVVVSIAYRVGAFGFFAHPDFAETNF